MHSSCTLSQGLGSAATSTGTLTIMYVIDQSLAVDVVLFSLFDLTTLSDALEQELISHTFFGKNDKGLEHLSANTERWIIDFSVCECHKTSVITW